MNQGFKMINKIFQINLTSEEVKTVNEKGHHSVPRQICKLDLSCKPNAVEIAEEALENGYYNHVANIRADNLEQVFEYGNIGPEFKIERKPHFPMASVSVGDVVANEDGYWLCARCGWEELNYEPDGPLEEFPTTDVNRY